MKRSLRLFAGSVVVAALSLGTTACDTSPYAADVNSTAIKSASLNAELSNWAGNRAYVNAFNTSNASGGGGSGLTVAGDAPGTYSTQWVANRLTDMIDAIVIHEHLVATGHLPDAPTMAAARAVSEISQIGWAQFSPAFRQTLVDRLADASALTPTAYDTATLQRVYNQYHQYFFTQICFRQATAPTLAAAQALAAGGSLPADVLCEGQDVMEGHPQALRQALMTLDVGAVSQPIATGFGYRVIQVTSRAVQPFSPAVQRTLSVAIVNAQGQANNALTPLLHAARIKVNPAYGSWNAAQSQVAPPKTPTLAS